VELGGQLRWLALREDNRPVVEGAGAIPTMVDIMARHPHNSQVQVIALEVLCNLAGTVDIAGRMANVPGGSVLDAVAEALRYFHRHQPLQLQACQLVRLLAASPGTSGPLVEKGMVGYLLAAMQNINTVKIQAECCGALGNMIWDDPQLAESFSQDGCVLQFILKSLQEEYSATDVVTFACHALEAFAQASITHRQLIDGEALDYYLLAMETHSYNPDVIFAACRALQPLIPFLPEEHHDIAVTLVRVLKRNDEHPDPAFYILILTCLVDILEQNTDKGCDPRSNLKAKVARLNAHAIVGMLQQQFPEDKELLEIIPRLFRSMAINKWEMH